MSNLRYILAMKNFEPAPPEYQYYCGTEFSGLVTTPTRHLFNGAESKDIIWDEQRDSALKLCSESAAADSYQALIELGFSNLIVFEIAQAYTAIDIEPFNTLVAKNKVASIISGLKTADIEYLEKLGVLDLTIVT